MGANARSVEALDGIRHGRERVFARFLWCLMRLEALLLLCNQLVVRNHDRLDDSRCRGRREWAGCSTGRVRARHRHRHDSTSVREGEKTKGTTNAGNGACELDARAHGATSLACAPIVVIAASTETGTRSQGTEADRGREGNSRDAPSTASYVEMPTAKKVADQRSRGTNPDHSARTPSSRPMVMIALSGNCAGICIAWLVREVLRVYMCHLLRAVLHVCHLCCKSSRVCTPLPLKCVSA